MVSNNNKSVNSEAEIPEWRKNDFIEGVEISYDNFLDLVIEHVSENNNGSEKRDLTENENKLDYFIYRRIDGAKSRFEDLVTSIYRTKHSIISDYTDLKGVEQNKATQELNDNMKWYKTQVTRYTNKISKSVKYLIQYVNEKRQLQEQLLFLQEIQDVFDEIKFGHVIDGHYGDYTKIAGYGYYRNKRIESSKNDISFYVNRIHEIINNPKEAKTSQQINEDNMKYFAKADKESRQFIADNISQRYHETDYNSYCDRIFTCNTCKKEFKSTNTRLSMGKQIRNIVKHLDKEHGKTITGYYNIYRILEDSKVE